MQHYVTLLMSTLSVVLSHFGPSYLCHSPTIEYPPLFVQLYILIKNTDKFYDTVIQLVLVPLGLLCWRKTWSEVVWLIILASPRDSLHQAAGSLWWRESVHARTREPAECELYLSHWCWNMHDSHLGSEIWFWNEFTSAPAAWVLNLFPS